MKLQLASCTWLLFSHTCISLLFPSTDCVGKTVIFVGEELCTQHSGWTNKVPAWSTVSASPDHEEMQQDPPQELRKAYCPAQPVSPPRSSSRKTKPKRNKCHVFYTSGSMTFFLAIWSQFLSLTYFPLLHGCFLRCLASFSFLSQFFP